MITNSYIWLFDLWKDWSCIFGFSWWNPLHAIELRRSIKVDRMHPVDKPFISVVISFLFIRFEWYLGKNLMYLTEDEEE